MRFLIFILSSLISISTNCLFAQKDYGKLYNTDKFTSIYLPLGKISFADSVIDFRMGKPPPLKKYSDAYQCLHEPNYTTYSSPTYLSLGCKGSITVAFNDNGFMNLPGYDLYIFEVGPSKESAKVEISQNGIDWIFAGDISGGKSAIELSNADISSEIVFYYLRITDYKEVCNSRTAGADIDAIGAINSVVKLNIDADVLFDVDQYTLKESSDQILDTLVKTIQQIKRATILVEGHTDDDGEESYNMILSENRCKSVVEKLKSFTNEDIRFEYEINAFGENKPKVLNDTPENKQLNRRVEITILPPKDYYDSLLKTD